MMPKKGFVRNDDDKQQKKAFSLAASFSCALSGLRYIIVTQRNLRIHLFVAFAALVLGYICAIPPNSWLAIVLCIGAVLAAEAINTAIETVVDLVSPEYNVLAKRAKDCAAAGVLITAIVSVVVAVIVFGPPLLALIF